MSIFHFPFSILHLLGLAAVSLLCGLLLWLQLVAAWPSIEDKIDQFRRQPPFVKLLLMLFVGIFVVFGSTKTNLVDQTSGTNIVEIVEGGTNGIEIAESRPNDVDQVGLQNGEAAAQGGDLSQRGSGVLAACHEGRFRFSTSGEDAASPLTVTLDDIARGWQLWEVRTNSNVCYMMPEDATLATNWWVRGAYENVKPIDFGSWRFPFGTNEYDSLWAFSWGKARFALGDAETEIVAVGAPMSAVPYRSRLWSAADTNGARVVTWENFVLGRALKEDVDSLTSGETPLPLCCAQIELRPTGDFIVRSNEVETVYRRVDPEDWDGDGWRNDDDYNPYVWEEFYDYFEQELPEGANENAYYWVEIRPRWHSYVEFVGDGPSNLGDPYLWAKAGETYRVQLLIGKTYAVVSSQPVDVVGRSSSSIEIDGNWTGEIEVVWPVTFSALEGNGSSFMMRVAPSGLGGTFTWTQHCCGLTGYGNQFWWAHERYCYCAGCYACGFYSYEGYEKECTGGHCCCPRYDDDDPYEPQEDDGPYASGASVEFSEAVVVFEDAYTNMPGEVVARQSTQTTLTCIAHGGETGGTATFSIENGNKLIACSGGSLPVTRFVPPLQKIEFEIVYEGKLPSGSARDIRAKADFTERVTGTRHSTQRDWLTSVMVELEASYTAVDNPNKNRHIFGVGEEANLKCRPVLSGISASSSLGMLTDMRNGQARYVAPPEEDSPVITINCGYVQKEITIDILEPEEYVVCSIATNFAHAPNEAGLIEMDFTNRIFPTYVSFYAIEVTEIPMVSTDAVGYFAQPEHADDLDHGKHGAYGQWSRINEDNSTSDEVAMGFCPKPWNGGGSFTWPIPNAWRVSSHNWATNIFTHTDQRFELDADGTARVSKFGWTGERGTNDTHRVYGGASR